MVNVTVTSNIALDDAATDNATSAVGEPSVAAGSGRIFVTGNWYASRSSDDGSSWLHVDPFTALPSAAGGFCCDQVTVHDAERAVWIWILQYKEAGGANVFRIAAASDADFDAGQWYWWDIGPTTLDDTFTDLWFDYPDAALSDGNLYVTFNMFNAAREWQRAAVMRFPLDVIAGQGTLVFDSWTTTEMGSLRLTQGARGTMYWAGHKNSQQVRLFAWPDADSSFSWWDVDVTPYSQTISSVGPTGVDWLSRADPRITGACVGDDIVTLMWTAGSDANRPQAYCKAVRIRESTKQLVDEPDIFSTDRAWAYPSVATNSDGVVGFTAFYGGADHAPSLVVGVRDDDSGAWPSVFARVGTDAPSEPKWGDYLTCRSHSTDPAGWVAAGYTLQGGSTRLEVTPQIVRFELQP
jgi:hypothetical protein